MSTVALVLGYVWLTLMAIVLCWALVTLVLGWIGGLIGRRASGPGGEVCEFRRRSGVPPARPRVRRRATP